MGAEVKTNVAVSAAVRKEWGMEISVLVDQPGELCEEAIQALAGWGQLIVPSSNDRSELMKYLPGVEAVLSWGNTKLDAGFIKACAPQTKVISITGIGVDNVDLETAETCGIRVVNTPGVNANAVAEYTIGALISAIRHIYSSAGMVKQEKWVQADEFTSWELRGSTIGVIGLGSIGKRVCQLLSAFDCDLLGYDPYVDKTVGTDYCVDLVDVDRLCRNSDAICIHAPLTEESFHLINSERIALLKKHTVVINAGRAPVVDEDRLYPALKNQDLAGYVTDVFPVEPPDLSNPIYKLNNVIATHHIGAMTDKAVAGMQATAITNIKAVIRGQAPSNIVV